MQKCLNGRQTAERHGRMFRNGNGKATAAHGTSLTRTGHCGQWLLTSKNKKGCFVRNSLLLFRDQPLQYGSGMLPVEFLYHELVAIHRDLLCLPFILQQVDDVAGGLLGGNRTTELH